MPIGVLGAMPEEVALLQADLQESRSDTAGGRAYHTGQLYGQPAVLAFSGWGKVAAASTATILIERYHASPVIFSGVAGAAAPELNIGDVVIGREFVQHDLDARPLFQQFEVPLTGLSRFPADARLVESLSRAAAGYLAEDLAGDLSPETRAAFGLTGPKVLSGLIASGDQFIGDAEILKAIRRALPGLQCVEMEGAAVAQVCHGFHVPLGVVRVISDRADHSAGVDFAKFIATVASRYSRGLLRRWVQSLAAAAACLLVLAGPVRADEPASCDPDAPANCECGKLPVCVISGSDMGFYSSVWFDAKEDNWRNFGDEAFKTALLAEIEVANALKNAMPCVEPILMDAYTTGVGMSMDAAKEQGLTDQLEAAKAAGDAARVAEIERKITGIFTAHDAGDFPWRDPALAQAHLSRRMLSCAAGRIELGGSKMGDTIYLQSKSTTLGGGIDGNDAAGQGETLADAAGRLVTTAAYSLNKGFRNMFAACQQVTGHCVTTNFELSNQTWECTTTTTCSDGRELSTTTETGTGIRAGMIMKQIPGCCSELAGVRNSDAPEDAEDRRLANEIWCEGTWNLRAGDMDCDGQPNASDSTPWPPGEGPSDQ